MCLEVFLCVLVLVVCDSSFFGDECDSIFIIGIIFMLIFIGGLNCFCVCVVVVLEEQVWFQVNEVCCQVIEGVINVWIGYVVLLVVIELSCQVVLVNEIVFDGVE